MCDDHPDVPAVARVQGETDSFGCEMHDLCQACLDELRAEIRTQRMKPMPNVTGAQPMSAGKFLDANFAAGDGETAADRAIRIAEIAATAKAAKLLAAQNCPADLIEWGMRHNIPTFAETTWQAGFLAGMRAAMLDETP